MYYQRINFKCSKVLISKRHLPKQNLFWFSIKQWRSQPSPTLHHLQAHTSPSKNSSPEWRLLKRTCLHGLCTMATHQPAGFQERRQHCPLQPFSKRGSVLLASSDALLVTSLISSSTIFKSHYSLKDFIICI